MFNTIIWVALSAGLPLDVDQDEVTASMEAKVEEERKAARAAS